jgi:hypothetical protein
MSEIVFDGCLTGLILDDEIIGQARAAGVARETLAFARLCVDATRVGAELLEGQDIAPEMRAAARRAVARGLSPLDFHVHGTRIVADGIVDVDVGTERIAVAAVVQLRSLMLAQAIDEENASTSEKGNAT